MMRSRALQLAAAFLVVILFGNVVTFTTKSNRYSESYPAVVCPIWPKFGDISAISQDAGA